ncbi:MAG TPA: hypothetical protein DER01_11430 [Phycisphaerales bacterium]|nr:hypothetical protein [Phycisphaerales bacterium]|tara:strand:- start:1124 stop:2548 length:1425 start_codon:yes stop_codon:yes gene_type:complete
MRSLILILTLCLCSLLTADEMPAVYDAAVAGDDLIQTPQKPVQITVDFDKPLIDIDQHFYGINVHPIPAKVAFRDQELVAQLKPDVIRIMGTHRTHWYRDDQNKSVTVRSSISTEPGQFDFTELDALVQGIKAVGAEPYLAIGFGAPKWLADPTGSQRLRRVSKDRLGEYAQFMADVVKHLNLQKQYKIKWVTIDNEPENLEYPLEDYITLVKLATAAIKSIDPTIQINGPVTGYATWKQPDGRKISFSSSLQMLKDAGLDYDGIDWHIYATNPQLIFKTVDIVKRTYPDKPLIISELNRDWRYAGKGGKLSAKRNTDWYAVAWLAHTYDGLQKMGVSQVHYFCLGNSFFGLFDYHHTKVHPNYHLFRLMTQQLGRKRVTTTSSDEAIGVIATVDQNKPAILIYNRAQETVTVHYKLPTNQTVQSWTLDEKWYDANKTITDGNTTLLTPQTITDTPTEWTIPARGVILLNGWEM